MEPIINTFPKKKVDVKLNIDILGVTDRGIKKYLYDQGEKLEYLLVERNIYKDLYEELCRIFCEYPKLVGSSLP